VAPHVLLKLLLELLRGLFGDPGAGYPDELTLFVGMT